MKFYEANATIKASPNRVWQLLTDAGHYTDWNATVDRVEGRISPGETIKVFVKVNPGRAFPVKVTEFKPNERMVWSGGMPLGLFKGVRTYTLSLAGDGATQFKMREEYTGPMLGMIWKSIPDLGPSFQEFAQSLKREAEK
jgi:uncharacterized protein YndB with AHSA1/START domain